MFLEPAGEDRERGGWQADDSNPASGQVRAQLQTGANPDTAAAPGISAYVETGVNQYLLCKNL